MWLSPLSSSVTEDDKLTKNVFTLFDQVREQLSSSVTELDKGDNHIIISLYHS